MDTYRIAEDRNLWYPMGVTRTENGFHFCVAAEGTGCNLVLFRKGKEKPFKTIPFPASQRQGNVWEMTLEGDSFEDVEYCYESDGKLFADPYGRSFTGREKWGSFSQAGKLMKSPVEDSGYDWEGDRPLEIPYSDMVVYRLHTRGFTKKAILEKAERGTFAAIEEKIPYIRDLGITTVELMPPAEFAEVMMPEQGDGNPYAKNEPTGVINYWGYTKGYYFAPKASFASGKEKDPRKEFKDLVKALHKAGIEIVIELYFTGKEGPVFVMDAIRFWVREYHVDGVHLVGFAPAELLGSDPFLSRTKLWATSWDGICGGGKHMAEYNDGFLTDMRRFLKGDEDALNSAVFRIKRNPKDQGVINYIANTNGFTLADMVSYEIKHNEKNGEGNRDGTNYNYTWNCGVEGPSRKKRIVQMRRQQIRNAVLMVFLSQGTPLIMAGDEFGNSKGGNNNSYCQDNEISWLDWELLGKNQELFQFFRFMIAFRKRHPAITRELPAAMCGFPQISCHKENAWDGNLTSDTKAFGILYAGYDGERAEDDLVYLAMNPWWEEAWLGLPALPEGYSWRLAVCTGAGETGEFYPEGEKLPEGGDRICLKPRSVTVLEAGMFRKS